MTVRLLVAALAAALAGCSLPVKPDRSLDADPFGPLGWIVSPTQGRPMLIKVGGQFPVQIRLPASFQGRVEMHLAEAAGDPANLVPLTMTREMAVFRHPPLPGPAGKEKDPAGAPDVLASGIVKVPDYAPAGLYDLLIGLHEPGRFAPLRFKVVPRAVGVYDEFGPRFRFVQLSNMDIGEPTAPDFSAELVEEVNRLAPAFIVTTGNYLALAAAGREPESWRRIKEYFARFDAPVFLVLGDHDDEPGFGQYVAASRSGVIGFGPCRGVLLYDTYQHPLDGDLAQTMWMDDMLKAGGESAFQFVVSPGDSLRLLDAARKLGASPAEYVRSRRVHLLIAGGYSDWDFCEQAPKLAGAPVEFVRTHMSSTCLRGKATGVPHYRIIDVECGGEGQPPRLRLAVPEDGPTQRALHSVPVGMLQVTPDRPNDGSADRMTVRILNRLAVPIRELRVKVRLKRSAGLGAPGAVEAVGGRIERTIDLPGRREVWLRIDCPDRGTATATVGPAGGAPPAPDGLKFKFLGDPKLTYRSARAADGFTYYTTAGKVQLQVANDSRTPRTIWPVIRLNGNVLSIAGHSPDQPIAVGPGQERILPINATLGLAAPGEHWLTLHQADDPAATLTIRPLELTVLGGGYPEKPAGAPPADPTARTAE